MSRIKLPRVWRSATLGRLGRAALLVWRASPKDCALTIAIQLGASLAVVAQLYFTKQVLDALVSASSTQAVLTWLASMALVAMIVQVAQSLSFERGRVLAEIVSRNTMLRITSAASRANLLEFEEPEFYNRVQRAQTQGQVRAVQVVTGSVAIVGAAVGATAIIVALAAMNPWFLPLAAASAVPVATVSVFNHNDTYASTRGLTESDRSRAYLLQLMLGRVEARELRAFQLHSVFESKYADLAAQRINEVRRLAARRSWRAAAGSFGYTAMLCVAIGFLTMMYRRRDAALAEIGTALFAMTVLAARVTALQGGGSSLFEAALFIQDFEDFIGEDDRSEDTPNPRSPSIARASRFELADVHFAYPGVATEALRGVTFSVSVGEIVALVGRNGSGKTTSGLLLGGLLAPTHGEVRWDADDVATLDTNLVRESTSFLFQDFVRYRSSIEDNIAYGAGPARATPAQITNAALGACTDDIIRTLPRGLNTVLGREFQGGVELSVGQWQRIALARAIVRDARLLILDEPTAAMDPVAEQTIFDHLRNTADRRAVLIISHRLSTVARADRVYVMDKGAIVEEGHPEELLAARGHYHDLYKREITVDMECQAVAK